MNEEKEICLLSRDYVSRNRCKRISMNVKCRVHMHIFAELKAYWLLVFFPLSFFCVFICLGFCFKYFTDLCLPKSYGF